MTSFVDGSRAGLPGLAVGRYLRKVESALETAAALDRAAIRVRNPRVAEVLHERAEARRRVAQSVRARLSATGAL